MWVDMNYLLGQEKKYELVVGEVDEWVGEGDHLSAESLDRRFIRAAVASTHCSINRFGAEVVFRGWLKSAEPGPVVAPFDS